MIITMHKLNKLRVEGNCVPILLVDLIFAMQKEISKKELDITPSPREICSEAVLEAIMTLPIHYRASAKKRAWSITQSLYNKYLYREGKDTGKLLMIVHEWVLRLHDEGLIDVSNQSFINLIQAISKMFEEGEAKGYVSNVGGEVVQKKPDDVIGRRNSAAKHVTKLHARAMDKDLYLSVRNDDGELEIVN